MENQYEINDKSVIAWCPGCGNFGILDSLKKVLNGLDVQRENVVFVSGIGQAAKTPQYLNAHYFNGLHGRALPVATAIKAANPGLTVIAESGDGCIYGEGGNHFIHTIRRNPDITNIVHNNMVYGLTKGQASPTSRRGFKTPVQTTGVFVEPFNPLAVAVALNASFAARAFIGDKEETEEIIKRAIEHRGYSLVDLFQPCVSFNKVNTYKWYRDNTYYTDDSYDPRDREGAFRKAIDSERFALGIIYINDTGNTFEDNLPAYETDAEPLYKRDADKKKIMEILRSRI